MAHYNTFHFFRYAHFKYAKCLFTNIQKQQSTLKSCLLFKNSQDIECEMFRVLFLYERKHMNFQIRKQKIGKINITIEVFISYQFLCQFLAQTDHFDILDQICPKKVTQKGHFQSKTDKMDTTIEFNVFELAFVSNFTLNKQFCGFSGLKQKR